MHLYSNNKYANILAIYVNTVIDTKILLVLLCLISIGRN